MWDLATLIYLNEKAYEEWRARHVTSVALRPGVFSEKDLLELRQKQGAGIARSPGYIISAEPLPG